jgi:hypothetical protein
MFLPPEARFALVIIQQMLKVTHSEGEGKRLKIK